MVEKTLEGVTENMKWLRTIVFSLVTLSVNMTINHAEKSKNIMGSSTGAAVLEETWGSLQINHKLDREEFSASTWSIWSPCRGGQKTRRKHCLHSHKCGGHLQVQVAKCHNNNTMKNVQKIEKTITDNNYFNISHSSNVTYLMNRQMIYREGIHKPRGFSAWSNWSACSRRCTTERKRYCQRPTLCGKQVIRQSAYCYVDGSYCQRWIRGRMQRRQDPGYTVIESKPVPAKPFYSKDSRPVIKEPKCGILGRYRGTALSRTRARMHEMLRIIGGRPAPKGKWPWQVAVLNRYREAFCGGTLISLRWAVTAAHCVRRRLYVRLGEHDLMLHDHGEMEMRVAEAVVHPLYDPDTVINDVAMLRLPTPARPDLGHGIVCLPKPFQPLAPHTNCAILGWGKRRPTDSHGTRILYEAQVSTINQGVCRRSYWQYAITDNMVCAGRGRRDSCAGDSGGPLLCRDRARYYLQGITSFGDGCGKRGKYGIYTRTSAYVPWMQSVISKHYTDD